MHEYGAVIARQALFKVYFYDSISPLYEYAQNLIGDFLCWPGRTDTDAHEHRAHAHLNGFILPLSTRHSHMASYVEECMVQRVSILRHMVI